MYVIKIGEPQGNDVKELREQYAPAWGVRNDRTNELWVGDDTLKKVFGLLNIREQGEKWLASSNAVPVTGITQHIFDDAYQYFFMNNPDVPKEEFKVEGLNLDTSFETHEAALKHCAGAYITWFRFWTKHAVDKLHRPVMMFMTELPV